MPGGFVYILESLSNSQYYIGSGENVDKRLICHNLGKVIATRNKGPWILKCQQQYPTITEARKIEYRLKKLKSKIIIDRIIAEQVIRLELSGSSAAASAPR